MASNPADQNAYASSSPYDIQYPPQQGAQALYPIFYLFVLMAPIYVSFGTLVTLFINADGKGLQWAPSWYLRRRAQRLSAGQDLDCGWQRCEMVILFTWWILGSNLWPIFLVGYGAGKLFTLGNRCCGREVNDAQNEPLEMVEETRKQQPARSTNEVIA